MDSGLTLTPVINLFFALTPANKPASPPNVLERLPFQKNTPTLGDFTRLWNFLGHEPPTRTVTPVTTLAILPAASFLSTFPPAKSGTPDGFSDDNTPGYGSPLSPSPVSSSSYPADDSVQTPRKDPKKVTFFGVKAAGSPLPQSTPGKKQRQSPRKNQEIKEIKVILDGQQVVWEERPAIEALLPIRTRRIHLMQKLKQQFPHDFSLTAATKSEVHVFIDNSNILIGFMEYIKTQRGYRKTQRIKRPEFSFFHLKHILERSRPVARRILVGSTPKTSVIDEAKILGYKCDLLEKITKEAPIEPSKRKRSGSSSSGSESSTTKNRIRMMQKEQAVDEVLNFKMCESLIDYNVPGTIVLASGDGAIGEFSDGFFKTVERALNRGWKVELVTFSANVSRSYKEKAFRVRWGKQFTIINLDPFAEELLGAGSVDHKSR